VVVEGLVAASLGPVLPDWPDISEVGVVAAVGLGLVPLRVSVGSRGATVATTVALRSPDAATPTASTACHASAVEPRVARIHRLNAPNFRMPT